MTELRLDAEGFVVHIYCDDVEAIIDLDEARYRGTPLTGPYSGNYHTARVPPGENHLHVFKKGKEIFAINVSGTAHDKSHGVRIPNRVAAAIRKHYPQIKLPKDNIIESMGLADEIVWLTEDTSGEERS